MIFGSIYPCTYIQSETMYSFLLLLCLVLGWMDGSRRLNDSSETYSSRNLFDFLFPS
jgi:hypothetical protein